METFELCLLWIIDFTAVSVFTCFAFAVAYLLSGISMTTACLEQVSTHGNAFPSRESVVLILLLSALPRPRHVEPQVKIPAG
jgi:uncharacterized membrane protein YjjP (DUF1212 family)